MYFGEYNELISETSGFPGSIGDSCANTARMVLCRHFSGENINPYFDALRKFRTDFGYVRHWDAPDGWREQDFSSDQMLPLYLAYKILLPDLADEMKRRLKLDGYRSGNGDLITPALLFLIKDWESALEASLIAQSLVFKLPYRWSDARFNELKITIFNMNIVPYATLFNPLRWLEELIQFIIITVFVPFLSFETNNASGDYQNFLVLSLFIGKSYVSKDTLKQKIRDYFESEPRNDFIVSSELRAVDGLF